MISSLGKRKSIRTRALVEARKRSETLDGILWDVYPSTRTCTVKIQGSDKKLVAYYPANWTATPKWLKPGNSVRLLHTGGKRHRLEVFSDGGSIPTPVDGGAMGPSISAGADCILTGMKATATSKGMVIFVSDGTYRISGVTYSLVGGYRCGQNGRCGEDLRCGSGLSMVSIPAAESGKFRLDSVFIGTDGILNYAKGNPVVSTPTEVATLPGHVRVANILVAPGVTVINQWDINTVWTNPFISQISSDENMYTLEWATSSKAINITLLDQYGNRISGLYNVKASVVSGSGRISPTNYNSTDGTAVFYYIRENEYNAYPYDKESGPVFVDVVVEGSSSLYLKLPVIILNDLGAAIL